MSEVLEYVLINVMIVMGIKLLNFGELTIAYYQGRVMYKHLVFELIYDVFISILRRTNMNTIDITMICKHFVECELSLVKCENKA